MTFLVAKADECGSATEFCKTLTVYDAITWISVGWMGVEENTIQKCFKRCGLYSGETGDSALQSVDILKGLEILAFEMREELCATEEEYLAFDDEIPCWESLGDTTEQIAEIILEQALDSKAVQGSLLEDGNLEEEDDEIVGLESKPKVENYTEAMRTLTELQSYCFASFCRNSLNFPVRKSFYSRESSRTCRQGKKNDSAIRF